MSMKMKVRRTEDKDKAKKGVSTHFSFLKFGGEFPVSEKESVLQNWNGCRTQMSSGPGTQTPGASADVPGPASRLHLHCKVLWCPWALCDRWQSQDSTSGTLGPMMALAVPGQTPDVCLGRCSTMSWSRPRVVQSEPGSGAALRVCKGYGAESPSRTGQRCRLYSRTSP